MQRASSLGLLDRTLTAMAYRMPRVVGCASYASSLPTDVAPQARACSYRQHCDHSLLQTTKVVYAPVACHNSPAICSYGENSTVQPTSSHGSPPILENGDSTPSEAPLGRDALAHSWSPGAQVRLSPSEPPCTDTVQDQGGRGAGSAGCAILAHPDLVSRPHFPCGSPSLEDPLEERPSFSGDGHNLAPASRPMEPARLVPGWDASDLSGLSQARGPTEMSDCSSASFLQEKLERRLSPSTLKVYVAAIAAYHDAVDGASLGKHQLIVRFLRGARRVNPPRRHLVPSWDLSVTLQGLREAPFEPLASVELKYLSRKTVLLTALVSIKRVGDLQAFSVNEACLEFGPGDSHVILRPRPGYVDGSPSPSRLWQHVSGSHVLRPPNFCFSSNWHPCGVPYWPSGRWEGYVHIHLLTRPPVSTETTEGERLGYERNPRSLKEGTETLHPLPRPYVALMPGCYSAPQRKPE
ncbi:Spastin [Labeo rohita]|uniref:Spastin n=1 Tax=Labeo rohita TaxID=84645 RepID=A0ABQ8L4M5_LABRO|nr:Spastin [Labeo rohita]